MTDAEILKLLATLGIDELSYQALALLPLIGVAWADGEIQDEERQVVARAMADRGLGEEAQRLVRNWLAYPPSADYLARGRAALAAAAARGGDLDLGDGVVDDVLSLSRAVARAAGGLWGLGAVSREERAAIDAIAAALQVDGARWKEAVARELERAPPRQRVLIRFDTSTLDLGAMPGVLTPTTQPDLQIPVHGAVVLGSDPGCDVELIGSDIAPRHCEVRAERGRFYARDLSEGAGTWVDGERIVERRLLGGETVSAGGAELRFQLLKRVPRQML